MKVKEILDAKGSQVTTIEPDSTLRVALCNLIENKVGALLVKDPSGALSGIITERDLMREVYQECELDNKKVGEVMTRKIVTAAPEDDIERIMNEMTEGRFRHMPVVKDNKLVGIVSIGDVVKAQLAQAKSQVTNLMDYVSGPTSE